ncbi:MAG: hypothetical protein CMA39_03030 [Euryarchaeota archaeon]|jgi:uncharacterized tellurite resistance protein B-like protein|nr:hypothetical protein [Euryarchaeota archaeon]|tara:strand:- start:518 stop:988 length:471 start_codon:yes stop_codon:yes gene_type:complete
MTYLGDILLPDAALALAEEQRRKIACTLVMVAAADGALVREEISAIESAMGLMMLHPESREEVRQLLTQPPDLDSILNGMEVSSIRLALRDAALLASVDGDYDDAELAALRKICDAAGLSEKELSKILDWVADYWKMSANGRSIISLPLPGDEDIL